MRWMEARERQVIVGGAEGHGGNWESDIQNVGTLGHDRLFLRGLHVEKLPWLSPKLRSPG